jgi:hypothetical protein
MASLEDYDEFGHYIGADLQSEDEDDAPQAAYTRPAQPEAAPLEGFDDEPMETQEETSLIQIDGDFFFSTVRFSPRQIANLTLQSQQHARSFCMKISNTTLAQRKSMDPVSRRWCRKRMPSLSQSPSSRPLK